MTPVSNSGYKFKEWGGTNGSEVVNNKILMNSDKNITAVFLAPPVSPVGLGTRSGSIVAWYNYSSGFLVSISVYISLYPSPTAKDYKVYIKFSSSGNYSLKKTTQSTSETIELGSGAKNSTVYFVVTATNEAGESGYSNEYKVNL